MTAPLLTIAVPVYNRASIVGRTLDSILGQSLRPLAVILVDNNSTDGSYDVLCRWRDAHSAPDFEVRVLRQPLAGAAAARNMALESTNTPWLMYFDSDDTMLPEHAARAMSAAQAHPEAAIIGWDTELHFIDGSRAVKPFCPRRLVYHGIMQGTMATQRYMVRTELLRQVGGWSQRLSTWDDIELGTRLGLVPGLSVYKVEGRPTVHVHQTEVSLSGLSYHSKARESEQALEVIYADLAGRPQQCIATLKMSVLAALYHKEGHSEDARRLLAHAQELTHSPIRRLVQRCAYIYTRLGGAGLATLLSPLYP